MAPGTAGYFEALTSPHYMSGRDGRPPAVARPARRATMPAAITSRAPRVPARPPPAPTYLGESSGCDRRSSVTPRAGDLASRPGAALAGGYRPFRDMAFRDAMHLRAELPLVVRNLALPRGARTLQVGCGRGVGLQRLADRCRPARLVGSGP